MENISALLGEVITKRGKDNISKEKDMEESLDYVDAVSYTHLTLPTICSV